MNQIVQLKADLLARFPALTFEVEEPHPDVSASGYWTGEIERGDWQLCVTWRPRQALGIFTPKEGDAFGNGWDESYADYDEALARVVELIETGGSTVPPLAVRIAELRAMRGLTQSELAERAGLKQANLSRFENKEDAKISTLQRVVSALGATLTISARFPDGSQWELRL